VLVLVRDVVMVWVTLGVTEAVLPMATVMHQEETDSDLATSNQECRRDVV
jgi:hypothetical protein